MLLYLTSKFITKYLSFSVNMFNIYNKHNFLLSSKLDRSRGFYFLKWKMNHNAVKEGAAKFLISQQRGRKLLKFTSPYATTECQNL